MNLTKFNNLPKDEVAKLLFSCCASSLWVEQMMQNFPFENEEKLVNFATDIWYNKCTETDWLQSFQHHPKIGDLNSLQEKFASKEQESVASASNEIIENLAAANVEYENKFGFIFIICATGKSANEMLRLLQDRMRNNKDVEIRIAMGEQQKITILRLIKILTEANFSFLKISQISTHILDTSIGKPAKDISIKLYEKSITGWNLLAQGITNVDGRIADFLPPQKLLILGLHKLEFELEIYFKSQKINPFFPQVEILFNIQENEHYHIPLLLNPYGYSTYRGS